MTKTMIVCENAAEEKAARDYLTGIGAKVGPTENIEDLSIYEVDANPPNNTFTGTYSRLGKNLRLVTGTWV
jgi:hypothetical protein